MSYVSFKAEWLGRRIDYDLLWWVKLNVLRPSNNHKILNSVVSLVVVNMVDDFIRIKGATKMLLHNKPVFQDFIMISLWVFRTINTYISSIYYLATLPSRMMGNIFGYIKLVTFITTKYVFTVFPTSILSKLLKAVIATKHSLSRLIITISRTRSFVSTSSSILAGGSLIFNSTYITRIFHNLNNMHNNVRSQ